VPEAKLTADEAAVLTTVLATLVVRPRTGEIGMVHGAERFVSTHISLKKVERDALDRAARKLGLTNGIAEHSA
jgi:hypothetical protein